MNPSQGGNVTQDSTQITTMLNDESMMELKKVTAKLIEANGKEIKDTIEEKTI